MKALLFGAAASLALAACSQDVSNAQIAKEQWNHTDAATAALENVWEVESNIRIKRLEERTAELEAELAELKMVQEAQRLAEARPPIAAPSPEALEAGKTE